jgi:hypothetical protein
MRWEACFCLQQVVGSTGPVMKIGHWTQGISIPKLTIIGTQKMVLNRSGCLLKVSMKAQIRELVTIVAKRSLWATERMIEQAIDALRICTRPPNRAVFPANCGSAKHRQNPKLEEAAQRSQTSHDYQIETHTFATCFT